MQIINIEKAQNQLMQLVEKTAHGKPHYIVDGYLTRKVVSKAEYSGLIILL